MTFLKLWGEPWQCRLTLLEGMKTNVQCHLDNCQVCFACSAKAPIQLSEAHCTLCKGTYPIVRSALHVVQRHLSNCQKHIARCAKVPWQLSEAHCTLCKGTLTIVRSPLQIATDVFIMQWIKKLNVAAIGKVLTLGQNLLVSNWYGSPTPAAGTSNC